MTSKIVIHTDGSCLGNPGPGGWATLLQMVNPAGQVQAERIISGYRPATTNNRMELRAAIAGLAALKSPRLSVELVTDSQYVIGMLNGNRARKNQDLISCLKQLAAKQTLTTRHVRGHTGHELNEQVDSLARDEANKLKELLSAETRAIVFGSRSFNNKRLMKRKLDRILARSTDVVFISGRAKGADRHGEEYANLHGHRVLKMSAEWDIYDKKAGFRRNDEMLEIATHAVGFWDGQSSGTRDMIRKIKERDLPLRVIRF